MSNYGIRFAPCTGFGEEGRTATLYNEAGEWVAMGCGATDEESVCEALMDSGMSFDEAFDNFAKVIKNARFIDRS